MLSTAVPGILGILSKVGIMIFLGYFMMYVVKYNISVHIIDMAEINKRTFLIKAVNETSDIVRSFERLQSFVHIISWDDMKVAKLFAAYHIGYCICFPIFHNLGDRLGPTWVVGIAGLISGILNCLTPTVTYFDFWALFVIRVANGFCAGAMQPNMVQVLRHWVPPIERNHFMWAYCGNTTGTFSTFLLCALVQYYGRWSVGFYISGTIQILWSAVWVLSVTDSPITHPCITTEEMDYLTNSIGTVSTIKINNSEAPWKLILKSVPFWALCVLNFGYTWMLISLCIHGPLFYSAVLNYSIYTASALTALPFIIRLILGTIVIQTYHWYRHNTKVKRIKHIRKYFIVVSHVIPGVLVWFCWLLPLIPGPIVLSIAVSLTAAGMELTLDLCYELSPNYMNSLSTVIKIISNISGIIIPFCVGVITQNYQDVPKVWKHIWCFHAMILFVSGVVFIIWGDTHVQPWNSIRYRYRRRPPQKLLARPKASHLSNIAEVDEEESTNRRSIQIRQFLNSGHFKLSQSKA